MGQPEPSWRPLIWVAGLLGLVVIGVLIVAGWRRDAVSEADAASTSLSSAIPSTTSPTTPSTTLTVSPDVTALSPGFDSSFASTEALGATLVAHIGQGDTRLVLLTLGDGFVVHDMPRNTYGRIWFDVSRTQYAFIDSESTLHTRPTRAAPGDADSSVPIATNVRGFAWSLDQAERIAWLRLDDSVQLLVEGTNPIRVVGDPGDVDLVGFDSTGFYVFGGDTSTPGEAWLRRLDMDGSPVAELPADLVHVGPEGLILIGRVKTDTIDGPYVFDWFVTDHDLASLTPIDGPPSAVAIATSPANPGAVAFLTFDGSQANVEIYRPESGLLWRFDLGSVRAWEIQWSDRFIVVSGTEQGGRGHLIQLLDTDSYLISSLVADDWVQGAQLISQPDTPSTD